MAASGGLGFTVPRARQTHSERLHRDLQRPAGDELLNETLSSRHCCPFIPMRETSALLYNVMRSSMRLPTASMGRRVEP